MDILNKMSLCKTYTSVSRRHISEATEPGGERETRLFTIRQWRDLIAKRKEKRRKKSIQRTWKKLVFELLRKRTMHPEKKDGPLECFK